MNFHRYNKSLHNLIANRTNHIFILLLIGYLFVVSRGLLTFSIGGYSNFVVYISFLLPGIAVFSQSNYKIPIQKNKLNFFLMSYCIYILLLAVISGISGRIAIGTVLLLSYFSIYFILLVTPIRKDSFYKYYQMIMMIVFLYLLFFSFIEILFELPLSTLQQYNLPSSLRPIFGNHRISSSIGSTLPFGVFIAYFTIYLFSRAIYIKNITNLVFFILSIFLVIGTYNRSALGMTIIGCLLISMCWVLVHWQKIEQNHRLRRSILFFLLISILAIIQFTPEIVINRFYAIFNWHNEPSNMIRFNHWLQALSIVVDERQFLFGNSLGASGNILQYFGLHPLLPKYAVTESYYIKIFIETGIIGLMLFLSIIFTAIGQSFKMLKREASAEGFDSKSRCIIFSFWVGSFAAHGVQLFFLQSLESTSVAFIFISNLAFVSKTHSSNMISPSHINSTYM